MPPEWRRTLFGWPGYDLAELKGLVERVIAQMVERFAAEGTLNREPLELSPERARQPESVLSFPGKVLADDDGDRLFIADTNHNRIVVASLSTGGVLDIIGAGDGGFADGAFGKPASIAASAIVMSLIGLAK